MRRHGLERRVRRVENAQLPVSEAAVEAYCRDVAALVAEHADDDVVVARVLEKYPRKSDGRFLRWHVQMNRRKLACVEAPK